MRPKGIARAKAVSRRQSQAHPFARPSASDVLLHRTRKDEWRPLIISSKERRGRHVDLIGWLVVWLMANALFVGWRTDAVYRSRFRKAQPIALYGLKATKVAFRLQF